MVDKDCNEVESMQEHTDKVMGAMGILQKNPKEMLEIKHTVIEMKS